MKENSSVHLASSRIQNDSRVLRNYEMILEFCWVAAQKLNSVYFMKSTLFILICLLEFETIIIFHLFFL